MYGGQPYESSDHFCALKQVIDDDTDPVEVQKELAQLAKDMVDARVENEVMNMAGGLHKKEFDRIIDKWLKEGDAGDVDVYIDEMSPYQQNIFQIIKRARKRIKSNKN